jgi:glucan 1,3-beta-glucosidase
MLVVFLLLALVPFGLAWPAAANSSLIETSRSDVPVFRNVRDFQATGDGLTDDTNAIERALHEGLRCIQNCAGTSTNGAVVYVPPGRYVISRTIVMPFYTQLIGDPNDKPVLVRAPYFDSQKGDTMIDADPWLPGGKNW